MIKHFAKQTPSTQDGVEYLYVFSDKTGQLEVHRVRVTEMREFLVGHKFVHCHGIIPRFDLIKP